MDGWFPKPTVYYLPSGPKEKPEHPPKLKPLSEPPHLDPRAHLPVGAQLHALQRGQEVHGHHRRQPLSLHFQLGVTVSR